MFRTKHRQWLRSASPLTILLALSGAATANPLDGQVVAGQATISAPNPALLEIEQYSDHAIVDWRQFNIGIGETTRFIQPTSDAWILNRVVGGDSPSSILGRLEANGNVVLVNPDGIYFGAGSQVDVNRLIATTADIDNTDFMGGRLNFSKPGTPSASIVNEGTISVRDYGLSALVAPGVRNSGTITARLGSVSLAAGNVFTIDPYGDGLVKLAIGDEIQKDVIDVATGQRMSDLVKNEGTLKADGGVVAMTAATARTAVNSVVNTTGVIEASSVGMRGGKIVLGGKTAGTKSAATPVQRVRVSGTLQATVTLPKNGPIPQLNPRGHIEITGEEIIAENASIDASGTFGGGTVLIGGDYMGGNGDPTTVTQYNIPLEDHLIPTASMVALDENSSINADALSYGNGGKVIVWSDEATLTAAAISARGGDRGGDGGFVETSGSEITISDTARISTTAMNGQTGTWLIDPNDFTAAASGGNITGALLSSQLAANNITISTASQGTPGGNGDIFINDTVSWSANLLTLVADRNIVANATVNAAGTAGITALYAQSDAAGDIVINAPVNIAATGSLQSQYGSGPLINYTIISSLAELQAIGLNGAYALGTNIDASATAGWNGGEGFDPIGDGTNRYSGILVGLGHTISQLHIGRPADTYVGLFGAAGTGAVLRDLELIDFNVIGNEIVGGLVGWNYGGAIANVDLTGTVEGNASRVGGLVGANTGNIVNATTSGRVIARGYVGGLVGTNSGSVSDSSSASTIFSESGSFGIIYGAGGLVGDNNIGSSIYNSHSTGDVQSQVTAGGLVGINVGIIEKSYSASSVSGTYAGVDTRDIHYDVGGLVGSNHGIIDLSYATGDVARIGYLANPVNSSSAGGLVGENSDSGIVKRSYASGSVTGVYRVGGLVGNNNHGAIQESFAIGPVTGTGSVGGLIGVNLYGTIQNVFASGGATGDEQVGGLVGFNNNGTIRYGFATGLVTGLDFVGGLAGHNLNTSLDNVTASVTDSFFDTQTTGQTGACGHNSNVGVCAAIGITTAQMKTSAPFINAGWDFAGIWNIDPSVNGGYPHLRWQAPTPPPNPDPNPDPNPEPPPVTLTLNPFSNLSTTNSPFQPSISMTGSGFDQTTEIRWTWTDPLGNTDTVVWNTSNNFGGGRFVRTSDTSATLSPVLVAAGDPAGNYQWSVTVVAGARQITRSFNVTFTQSQPVQPPTENLKIIPQAILNSDTDRQDIAPRDSIPLVGLYNISPFSRYQDLPKEIARDILNFSALSEGVYYENYVGYELATIISSVIPGFSTTRDMEDGFFADVLQKVDSGKPNEVEIVVVYRGTQQLIDWYLANYTQLRSGAINSSQYLSAKLLLDEVNIAQKLLERQGIKVNITVTGHSLGGALAQYASAKATGPIDRVVTFNSAGLSGSTALDSIYSRNGNATIGKIIHVRGEGDPVSLIGLHLQGEVYNVPLSTSMLWRAALRGTVTGSGALTGLSKEVIDQLHGMTSLVDRIKLIAY